MYKSQVLTWTAFSRGEKLLIRPPYLKSRIKFRRSLDFIYVCLIRKENRREMNRLTRYNAPIIIELTLKTSQNWKANEHFHPIEKPKLFESLSFLIFWIFIQQFTGTKKWRFWIKSFLTHCFSIIIYVITLWILFLYVVYLHCKNFRRNFLLLVEFFIQNFYCVHNRKTPCIHFKKYRK